MYVKNPISQREFKIIPAAFLLQGLFSIIHRWHQLFIFRVNYIPPIDSNGGILMSFYCPQEILLSVEQGNLSAIDAFKMLRNTARFPMLQTEKSAMIKNQSDHSFAELDNLVGVQEIKKLVREIYAYIEIQKKREKEKLAAEPLVLHMIFKGNPGTGKTTVARVLGKIFCEIGILRIGHLIEIERADLVGEYIGHTAQKTREQLKRAYGGILFIDEAYSLARGGEKDFGKESIDVLVKAMEDHKGELILILAGYQQEMEHFLQTNPGLRSRFPIQIDFPDFTQQELLQIAEQICEKRQYRLSNESKLSLIRIVNLLQNQKSEPFGNARTIRNIIEKGIRRQALRLFKKPNITRDELIQIDPSDLLEVKECGNL